MSLLLAVHAPMTVEAPLDYRPTFPIAQIGARDLPDLPQLLQDRRVLEGRHVLRDLLALRDGSQKAPHDLAGARLRQVVAKADVLRLRDRADFLADPVAQFLRDLLRLVAVRYRPLQHHERTHRFARKVV